ncbi:nuclear transport factor 2 family protein [Polymorphobacter megasporae]|uniref:nuclear transport factor 2 family protein n=1 Tax=Glacieibacterium megasporae TaxID=2835787 RepID=UPI001C1DDCEC|nr:nuclear transport factor 2 family protein [Polymorphobacter megasporae]UAJ10560.1 nuclear transport factor 2 family protein [Polymorphobacter megasporae]
MTPTNQNREIVRGAFDAWAAGRSSVFDVLADDAVWTIPGTTPGAGEWRGRQEYVDAAVTPLFARLAAPARPELTGIWADGDEVILRWRQNTPLKAGGSYCNEYAWFFTMRDGRATAVTAFLDLPAYAAATGTAA